ncbi:hypothetical protein ATANTOWER_013927 [Ataeniobius toweri]|uniref:Uncharacterized protein n=1 Tax=Ataeniobius toweri TaxID=208326 RepID=A0ABU7CGZ0_9TELE|nr:hypothetical protein [Ataeniobius toweri]
MCLAEAQLPLDYSEKCQPCKSACHSSCQTQPLWERLTSSNKPSSTSYMPVQILPTYAVQAQFHFVFITNKLLNPLFFLCICATSRVI